MVSTKHMKEIAQPIYEAMCRISSSRGEVGYRRDKQPL